MEGRKVEKKEKSTMKTLNRLRKRMFSLHNKVNALTTLINHHLSITQEIREIITRGRTESGKKKAIRAYNAFNGNKNISEVEEASDMDHSTLIQALDQWEDEGIIFLHHKKRTFKILQTSYPLST